MRLKSFGVVALALLMVMSFASLASADETPADPQTTTTTIEPGTYDGFSLFSPDNSTVQLVDFILYWGFADVTYDNGCQPVDPLAGPAPLVEAPTSTIPGACLDVSGPNGQVNHGTFVSSFVHWLKSDEGQAALGGYSGPRGKLVKQAARNDFGKGQWKKDQGLIGTTDASTPELTDTQEDGPGHGNGKNK